MLVFYYLTPLFFSGLLILINLFLKKVNQKKIFKYICLALFCLIILIRFFFDNDYLLNIIHLESNDYSKLTCGSSLFFTYIYLGSTLVLCCSLYLKNSYSINTIKWITMPLVSICYIGLPLIFIGTSGVINTYSTINLFITFELGFAAFFIIDTWINNTNIKLDSTYFKFFIIIFLIILFISFPDYGFRVLFGELYGFSVINFSLEHIGVIFMCFILLFSLYFLLKGYEKDILRYILLMFTVSAFFSYNANIKGVLFRDITTLPLHLCNTAMYLIPLSLILNKKEIYQYLLFINLAGACSAMCFPIEYESVTSPEFMEYFYNHYDALIYPLLIMFLGLYPRPTDKKVFISSIIIYTCYFIIVYVLDLFFDGNYFFLAEDRIAKIIGDWCVYLYYNFSFEINIGKTIYFRPLYRALIYFGYFFITIGMYYIYKLCFYIKDKLNKTINPT